MSYTADTIIYEEQYAAINRLAFWLQTRPSNAAGSTIRPTPRSSSSSSSSEQSTLGKIGSAISESVSSVVEAVKNAVTPSAKPVAKKPSAADDDDDDFLTNLSSDDEDEDSQADAIARRIAEKKDNEEREARATKARAAGKKAAKSTLVLDIKPEDDETDLDDLEKRIRENVTQEGLLFGECQRIPIAFGIKKLRLLSVVVDDLVSTDDIQERIEALEGVQSSDIFLFNKI